jgi:transposase
MATLREIVSAGPDLDGDGDGIVRWSADLAAVIKTRFGLGYHESSIGKLLRAQGFSHVSARRQHPKQGPEAIEDFKKTSRRCAQGNRFWN